MRLNIEISKSAVLLAKNIKAARKKMLQMIFVVIFAIYLFTQNDSVNGMSENVAPRRVLTKMAALVFHRI